MASQVLAFTLQIDGIKSLEDLKKSIKETTAALNDKDIDSPEFKALQKTLSELKAAQSAVNLETRRAADASRFAAGSYDEMNARLGALRRQYKEFGSEERNSPIGQETVQQIELLDTELKRIDGTLGQFQRNVGNYLGVYDKLNQELKDLKSQYLNLGIAAQKGTDGTRILAQINAIEGELTQLNAGLNQSTSAFDRFGGAFNSVANTLATLGLGVGIYEVVNATAEYSRSLSELQSLLGLSDEEVTNLEGAIGELTTVTVEGGATIVNTGKDIADALKLAGSARPDLLGNTEALAQFTKEAIVFSKAGSLPLQDGIDALSSTLNQFTLPATDAGRVMNTLAAAAKEGNAEIKDQTASFERFGAVASAANVSVEESAALVEVLAAKSLKGAEAGTALRNVLTLIQAPETLGKGAQAAFEKYGVTLSKLSDTSLPVGERLKELSKISGDATAMVEVFGKENLVAGQILLNSTKNIEGQTNAFDTLLPKITGTNEAYTAAGINADNLAQFIDNLKATAINLAATLGGAGYTTIKAISDALGVLVGFVNDNKEAFIAAGLSVAAYTAYVNSAKIAQLAYNATMALYTLSTNAAAVAQRGLAIATAAVPYVAVGLLVFGLVKAIQAWTGASEENLAIQNAFNEAAQESATAYAKEVVASEKLVAQVNNETLSRKERSAAFSELQKQYPSVLANYKTEADFLANIEQAQRDINASILDGIVIKLKQQQTDKAIQDNFKKVAELEAIRAKGGVVGIGGITFSTEQLDQATKALEFELGKQLEIVNASAEQFRSVLAANSQRLIENERSKAVAISATSKEIDAVQTKTTEKVTKDSKKQETTLVSLRKELERLQAEYNNAAKKGMDLIPVEVIDGIDKTKKAIEDLEKKLKSLNQLTGNDKLRAEASATQLISIDASKAKEGLEAYLGDKEKLNRESNDKQITDELAAQKELLDLKAANDKAAAEQEAAQRKDILQQIYSESLNLARSASDAIFQIQKEGNQRELEQATANLETEQAAELALVGNNQAQIERINARYAAQKEALDRKAFEQNKKLAIAQALINGALAATAVFAVPDFTFGIASGIRLGFIAANTALQVAAISQQQFAEGGFVQGAGTGTSDSIPARLSNGEFVLTAATTKALGVDTLNAINQTGQIPASAIPNALLGNSGSNRELIDAIVEGVTKGAYQGTQSGVNDGLIQVNRENNIINKLTK
jgi:TP901 family phage tail tape measure protein